MKTVAAVWQGEAFPKEYPEKLRRGVLRHTPGAEDIRFLLLTDRDEELEGWETRNIDGKRHPGWWGKMRLLDPFLRGPWKTVFLDLDTVVNGDINPLFELETDFAICKNFHPRNVCRYGSAVMVFGGGFGQKEYDKFAASRKTWMQKAGPHGDQRVFEWLIPKATILQEWMPSSFFLHKAHFNQHKPKETLLIFAGSHKPHNSPHKWVSELWV